MLTHEAATQRPAPAPTRTAVLALVPAADPVVGPHREHLDRAAAWGVPAHVTVIHPFVAPDDVDDELVTRLGAALRRPDLGGAPPGGPGGRGGAAAR